MFSPGTALRIARTIAGLPRERVALLSGVKPLRLFLIEKGRAQPSGDELMRLWGVLSSDTSRPPISSRVGRRPMPTPDEALRDAFAVWARSLGFNPDAAVSFGAPLMTRQTADPVTGVEKWVLSLELTLIPLAE